MVHLDEAEEAFEWRDVPMEMRMESDDAYDGMFSAYYESNNGRWAETMTITIDTAVMDATPEAFLPTEISEVDALLVCETRYVAWGTLRVQYGVTKGRNNGLALDTYRDYRCYGVEQSVTLYTGDGKLIRRFGIQETAPTGIQNRTDGFRNNFSEEDIRRGCHAQPDEAWMDACLGRVMTMLTENEGDMSRIVLAK